MTVLKERNNEESIIFLDIKIGRDQPLIYVATEPE